MRELWPPSKCRLNFSGHLFPLDFVFQNPKPLSIYSKYLTVGVGSHCINQRNCVWVGKDYLEIV